MTWYFMTFITSLFFFPSPCNASLPAEAARLNSHFPPSHHQHEPPLIIGGRKWHGVWLVLAKVVGKLAPGSCFAFFTFRSKLQTLCARPVPPPVLRALSPPRLLFKISLALNASLTLPSPLLSSSVLVSLMSKDKLCKENKPRFSAGL